jgi:hypothetical protein
MYVEFIAEDFRTRVQFSPPPLMIVDKMSAIRMRRTLLKGFGERFACLFFDLEIN